MKDLRNKLKISLLSLKRRHFIICIHNQIKHFLFSENDFFNKYKAENGGPALNMLLSMLRYEYLKTDKPIMHFGEVGTKYYIILNGEVSFRLNL